MNQPIDEVFHEWSIDTYSVDKPSAFNEAIEYFHKRDDD